MYLAYVFDPPKFNADGSLNPRHELSHFVIVFIDDNLICCSVRTKSSVETVPSDLRKHKLLLKLLKRVWARTATLRGRYFAVDEAAPAELKRACCDALTLASNRRCWSTARPYTPCNFQLYIIQYPGH